MADGVILHREQLIGTGTFSPRPPALAGITPKAVLVYGAGVIATADGVQKSDAAPFFGFSDGVSACCESNVSEDGLGTSATRACYSANHLILSTESDGTTAVLVDVPNLVSGGFDANISVNTISPNIVCVFFYGDDWQAHVASSNSPAVNNSLVIPTGFAGQNNNQILFSIIFGTGGPSPTPNCDSSGNFNVGVACRQGASEIPSNQGSMTFESTNNVSRARLSSTAQNNRIQTYSDRTTLECTAIRDDEIEVFSHQVNASLVRAFGVLVISTGDKRTWCGIEDSLTANGSWIVDGPNFEPIVAGFVPSQIVLLAEFTTADNEIGGQAWASADREYSELWSNEDNAATMNAKGLGDSQFLNVPQDNNNEGWKSGANDFSLTPTGFRVDNVVVDGGGGGSPLTARKWLAWAIEGAAGPPPAIVGTGTLEAQSAAVVGVGEVISPTVITGTGALQAQDAAVVGVGEVFGVIAGTGALQAQDATVVGVGDVAGAAIGTGALQAQSAQVSGIGAVVHAGSGALQAQPSAVIGVGEVGNVRTGAGALQAGEAAVVGTGIRVSVGSGALQAQGAAVSGAGVVEGLTSGTGVLQAQGAAVAGTGHLIRVGSGALQAQAAQVAGVGAILGEITLSPADIAAIADAVYAKLVSEGLVQQINEIWQRRGLDPANPQTYDKAGNEIRVGNITIDLSGDPSSVTQTRQP